MNLPRSSTPSLSLQRTTYLCKGSVLSVIRVGDHANLCEIFLQIWSTTKKMRRHQLYLSFIGILSFFLYVPCCAFTAHPKSSSHKCFTDVSNKRRFIASPQKSFGSRHVPSSIFSSGDDLLPLESRRDNNGTQSTAEIAEINPSLTGHLDKSVEAEAEAEAEADDNDSSSTASLYKDIYSVRIIMK